MTATATATGEDRTMTTIYAMRGNGKAIHYGQTSIAQGLVTWCDRWAESALVSARGKGRVRIVEAEAATCKTCLKMKPF